MSAMAVSLSHLNLQHSCLCSVQSVTLQVVPAAYTVNCNLCSLQSRHCVYSCQVFSSMVGQYMQVLTIIRPICTEYCCDVAHRLGG